MALVTGNSRTNVSRVLARRVAVMLVRCCARTVARRTLGIDRDRARLPIRCRLPSVTTDIGATEATGIIRCRTTLRIIGCPQKRYIHYRVIVLCRAGPCTIVACIADASDVS